MSDSRRIPEEIGISPAHRNSFQAALRRYGGQGYRENVAKKCFEYSMAHDHISLVLYDVTTLYFEAEK